MLSEGDRVPLSNAIISTFSFGWKKQMFSWRILPFCEWRRKLQRARLCGAKVRRFLIALLHAHNVDITGYYMCICVCIECGMGPKHNALLNADDVREQKRRELLWIHFDVAAHHSEFIIKKSDRSENCCCCCFCFILIVGVSCVRRQEMNWLWPE